MVSEINKFHPIHSKTTKITLEDSKTLKDKIQDCKYVVLYYMDRVEIKCVTDLLDNWDITYLQELRAFNSGKEVYLIRVGDKFIGRIREDGDGDDVKVFDEDHRLWGQVPREKTTNVLKEDRGIEITLPFEVEKNEYVFIKVRNYFTAEGDLACVDWRFMGFKTLRAEKVITETTYSAEYIKLGGITNDESIY